MKTRLLLTGALCAAATLTFAAVSHGATSPVHRYQTGQNVRNAQWLLAGHKPSVYRIQSWRHPITGVYDKRMVTAVRNMKYRLGWPAARLDGNVIGARMVAILKGRPRPYQWKLTAGKRINARTTFTPSTLTGKLRILVADANYLIANAALVHYSQTVRMQIVRQKIHLPPLTRTIYEDCSSSTTGLYWLAGLPDPNGRGYDGYGYTGTQSAHGTVVWRLGQPLSLLRPGDLIFYGGGWPHHHVTMYLGNGRVFSHGTDTGPFNLPALYRSDAVSAHRYVTP